MIDVDGLTRRFGSQVAQHLCIAALLHKIDVSNRPDAYDTDISISKNVAPIVASPALAVSVPVLTSTTIASTATTSITNSSTAIVITSHAIITPSVTSICSVPILLCHTSPDHC